MAKNFRQLFKWLVPSWLSTGDGEKVLHTLAMLKDAHLERVRQGLEARFPSRAHASALLLLGQDRGIPRGRDETNAHYAQRLIRWRWPAGHRVRGNSFALLEQYSEYFGGVDGDVIDVKGNKRERTAEGEISYSYGNAWDWDGEGASPAWARFWVVLDGTELVEAQDDYGETYGQTGVSAEDVEALRRMMRPPRPWKCAGTRAEWIIVSLDGSDPEPDGTWLTWSQNVAGVQTPTRSSAHRYWSLAPTVNNVYAGNPDNYPEEFISLSGGPNFGGNPDNFPATITLTDGSTYAGNPDNFPTSFQLVDDGDPTP
jgi:hypothetical protein